jgi:hypothetical protein
MTTKKITTLSQLCKEASKYNSFQVHLRNNKAGNVRNAVISDISLLRAEIGFLTFWMTLDYGDSCQSFGGYPMFGFKTKFGAFGSYIIWRIMDICNVDDFYNIKNKPIRAFIVDHSIYAIGHFTKDDWISLKFLMEFERKTVKEI